MFRIWVLPFTLVTVLVYLGLVAAFDVQIIDSEIESFILPSGKEWAVRYGDLVLVLGLALLFVEILGATSTKTASVINHGLSTLVFILSVILFILLPDCGTSTFFLITLMSALDVVAGYSITIIAARRDLALGAEHLGRH